MNLLRYHRRAPKKARKQLGYLGLILACFTLPIVFAYYLYFTGFFIGTKGKNHGILIASTPALNQWTQHLFPEEPATWKIIYLRHGPCDATCQKASFTLMQMHKLLDKNEARVRRIFLTNQHDLKQQQKLEHMDYQVKVIPQVQMRMLFILLARTQKTIEQNGVFILDPHNNIVLLYPEQFNYQDILYDLKHLLKVSQIG